MSRRRAALENLSFGYLTAAISVCKSLLLVPLYLNYFPIEVLGVWMASGSVISLLGMLETGTGLVFAQRLSRMAGARRWSSFSMSAASSILATAVFSLLLVLISAIIAPSLPAWLNAPQGTERSLSIAFLLASLGTSAVMIRNSILLTPVALQQAKGPGKVRLLAGITEIVAISIGLVLGLGVVSLGTAAASSGLLSLALSIVLVMKCWRRQGLPFPRFNFPFMMLLLRRSFPYILSRGSQTLVTNAPTAIISTLLGPGTAASYAIVERVFQFCRMLLGTAASSLFFGFAHAAAQFSPSRLRGTLSEAFSLTAFLGGIILPVLVLVTPSFVQLWIGSSVSISPALVLSLGISTAFVSRAGLSANVALALGMVRPVSSAILADQFLRIALACLLLPIVGVVGFPIAVALASSISIGLIFARLLKKHLSVGSFATLRIQLTGLAPVLGLMIFAFAAGPYVRSHISRWSDLFLWAAAAEAAVLASLLSVNAPARRLSLGLLRFPRTRVSTQSIPPATDTDPGGEP